MKAEIEEPPVSPTGDVDEWRRRRQEWVDASWAHYLNGSVDMNEATHEDKADESEDLRQQDESDEQEADGVEIEGTLRPLVPEGERIMVCIGYRVVATRYGKKDYLYWRESSGLPVLEQFFKHYDKYPVHSKAVGNYITALGRRPSRLDRMSWRTLVGLKAEVYVETAKPTYANGALKGREKPAAMHYSKVSEILRPLGHVDSNTLRQLREKS